MKMSDTSVRILGIDPGKKRVGLATADSGLRVVTGYGVIEYRGKEQFIGELRSIIENEEIGLIVLGLPLNMDGSEGESAKNSRRLADLIKKELNIPVELADERLTTSQAKTQLKELDEKVGNSKMKINMLAAILILRSYLDSQSET